MRPCPRLVLAAVLLLAVPSAAMAAPAYVGTWGVTAAQCKIPQERQGAPLVMKAKGYDQHEAHCTFTSVRKSAGAWKVAAQCLVEGSRQKDAFALKVEGDTLILTQGKVARTYKRCS